jgi:hypothetical protein
MFTRFSPDEGSMGIMAGALAIVILLSLAMFSLFIFPGYSGGQRAYSGLNQLADSPVIASNVTGYADISGSLGPVQVTNPAPSPDKLGAVLMKVQLDSLRYIWKPGAGVDLDKSTVVFASQSGREVIPRNSGLPMKKPGWAIVQKGSTMPYLGADQDNILEPNEAFVLFVYPSSPLPPSTPFTVTINMPEETALTLNRTVPLKIKPVMNLG